MCSEPHHGSHRALQLWTEEHTQTHLYDVKLAKTSTLESLVNTIVPVLKG